MNDSRYQMKNTELFNARFLIESTSTMEATIRTAEDAIAQGANGIPFVDKRMRSQSNEESLDWIGEGLDYFHFPLKLKLE